MHWILDSLSAKSGFRIPIISEIPDSLSCLPDSKAQDSGCHKQKFPAVSGIRIPFMGREQATLVGPGGEGALKESLGRAVPPRPSNSDPV